jgi:polysaccharide export outer membrane protein
MKLLSFFAFLNFFLSFAFISSVDAQESPREFYRVGINDVIQIRVAGHDNLVTKTAVAFDGTISFPYLGAIYVEGMTLNEIKEQITEGLSDGYVNLPVVSVFLLNALSKKVFIQGIGEVPYEHNLTVGKALLMTGVLKGLSTKGEIIIRRKPEGKSVYFDTSLDIKNIIEGNEAMDMPIKPDDIIIIRGPKTVLIQGWVLNPGSYPIEENMTIGRALSVAGGVKEGAFHGKVQVRRVNEDNSGYRDIEVKVRDIIEGGASGEVLLKPNDIVRVKSNESFFIHGEVVNPGKYVLEDDTTVVEAITKVGGITENGLYGDVKIRRKRKDGAGYGDIDVDFRGIIDGSVREDVVLYPDDILIVEKNKTFLLSGEVNNPGEYVIRDYMTIGKALTLAGGVKEGSQHGKVNVRRVNKDKSGWYDIELDLQEILEGGASRDTLLQPDDVVKVVRGKTFIMWGEVNKIGEFQISPDTTVFKAILMAGGFNKWGSARHIKVLRPKKDGKGFETIKVNIKKLLDGDASADLLLQAEDIVIVSSSLF